MTSTKDTRIVWQVQSCTSSKHKWVNRGRHETRASARASAKYLRIFGGARVVRIELPIKAKKGKA